MSGWRPLFDLRYERAETEAHLRDGVLGATGSGTVTLIEVRTDRAENLALHRALAERGLSRRAPGASPQA